MSRVVLDGWRGVTLGLLSVVVVVVVVGWGRAGRFKKPRTKSLICKEPDPNWLKNAFH